MRKIISLFFIALTTFHLSLAQKKERNTETVTAGPYIFNSVIDLEATPVKNQSATGTCWCFATTSFIESELMRMGKGEYDLSEMFIVRHNYLNRLKDNYLRRGKGNLGPGSLSHDWMKVFTRSGIVPDEIYPGLNYGSSTHNHHELQDFINAVAAVPVELKNESDQYKEIVNAILDSYLGKVPDSFTYKGMTFDPESFADFLGINPDDYVQITSFTHFPFYSTGVLEVPDNWSKERFCNVPLDELTEIMDYSFNNGYTVNWDGDVSEPGFSHTKGYAVMVNNMSERSQGLTDRERFERQEKNSFENNHKQKNTPLPPEITVTQKMRQEGYENFTTTDDHLMHMTGIVKDQNGTKYYKTKNSWGTDRNSFGGYLNISENYVRAKTLFIMVNKNGIPPAIRTKLGI